MNRISKLLPLANIVIGLETTSKKRVFEQAGLLFENNQGIARVKVFDSLFARERLGSTGLGDGIAIPHGRIKGIDDAVAALIRLSQPVAFDAPDGKPVGLLLFLLVPEQATQQHLEILSEVAEMLSDESMRSMLLSESDPQKLHQALEAWQPARA